MSLKLRFKKGIALALGALFIFCGAGCDGGGDPADTSDTTVSQVPVTDEEGNVVTDESGNTVYQDPEPEKIYKVGFIYNTPVDYGATNDVFENARKQIEKTLALETCYIENALVADIPTAVYKLKEDGCNIIVSCSPKFANSISKEAKAAKDIYFLNFGGADYSANLSSFGGKLYQTSSICGLAAAYNTSSNIIGIVADPSAYNVYGVINGFVLGAQEIWGLHTDVRVNWAWSNDEEYTKKAIDDLVLQGCDVVMCYMENNYAAEYCNELGVKVIANAHDIPEIAPDNYISGFFFNFSTYLVDEIRSIVNNNFVSESYVGDIASGCARLVDFSENCKDGTLDICDRLYQYTKSGKAEMFTGELKNRDGKVIVEKGQVMKFDGIREIDWFVQCVRGVGKFTQVTQNPTPGDMTIKK